MPGAKNDAEILRGPGKEHLEEGLAWLDWHGTMETRLTFMLQRAGEASWPPWSIPPWSIPPWSIPPWSIECDILGGLGS